MHRIAIVGLILPALLAGCGHLRPGSPGAGNAGEAVVSARRPGATSDTPSPLAPSSAEPKPSPVVVEPTPITPPRPTEPPPASHSAVDQHVAPLKPVPVTPGRTGTTAATSVAHPAVTPAPAPKTVPAAVSAVTAPPSPPSPPSLDLAALEQRLRDTHAVGVFTKLSLKNQVDALLGQLRTYYLGSRTPPPTELRRQYDGLMLKVLSVLQDGDPPLAAQIWSSREAIWGLLADPAKFEKI